MLKNTLAALLFASSVAACGPAAAPSAEAPETTLVSEAAQTVPAEGVPTPQMLVGRWGDNGDCTKDIVFNADGSFTTFDGGAGQWTLTGDRMSMTGQAGTFQVRVAIVNQNTLMIGNADGSYGMSQRC